MSDTPNPPLNAVCEAPCSAYALECVDINGVRFYFCNHHAKKIKGQLEEEKVST